MKRLLAVFFILLHLTIGLLIVDDVGVPVDEYGNLYKGRVTLHYVKARFGLFDEAATAHALADWEKLQAKYYGTFFEMMMTEATDLLRIEDEGKMFTFRHRVVFLLFWLSGIAVYGTLRTGGVSDVWSLAGWVAYILHPRIFTQSFYNHKDVAFLAMCAVCLFFMTRWLLKNCKVSALLFILSAGVASATRVMGIELLALGLGWWGWRQLAAGGIVATLKRAWVPVLILLGFASVIFVCWPYLWEGPVERFNKGFSVMANYTVFGGANLYKGEMVASTELPADYIPHWIAITTPFASLIALLAGVVLFLGIHLRSLKRSLLDDGFQLGVIGLLLFAGTILAVLAKGSALYDGWRQVYFIWPGLIIAATVGLSKLNPRFALPLLVVLAIEPVVFLSKAHPHGMVYFNALAGRHPAENYEADYWGLGYRDGLMKIAEHQPEGEIKVYDTFWRSLYYRGNVTVLPEADRKRFVAVRDPEEADYLITNYRAGETVKSYERGKGLLAKPFYELTVNDVPVVGVYDLR